MDLVLFGMQGSGKGTQSKLLAEHFGLAIFEAGAELRKISAKDTPLGRKVKETIEAGHLVTSEIVMEIAEQFLLNLPGGQAALFDGIPRSQEQKELFDTMMQKEGRTFMGVLIELSEEEALRRLTTRRVCEKCKSTFPSFYDKEVCENCGGKLITRMDDNPEAIRIRLDTFSRETTPILKSYTEEGKMLRVNGEQSIEAVTKDLFQVLESYYT